MPRGRRSRREKSHNRAAVTSSARHSRRRSFYPATRRGRLELAAGVAVAFLCFSGYFATISPSITTKFGEAGSGDLASAVATWGVPHPTGYPLYVLLGGVVSHLLPFGQLAFRLNLFSAACSATALGLVFLTLLRLVPGTAASPVVRYTAAVSAALVLACCRIVWAESVVAEVYPLELLFAAAIAFILAGQSPEARTLLLLGLAAGLALTNALTIVFSLSGATVYLWLRLRRAILRRDLLIAAAALFVLPLCLYALLPLRAAQHPASNWGDPTTLGRFIDDVTAAPYRSTLEPNPWLLLQALPAALRSLLSQFMPWVLPAAMGGAFAWRRRNPPYVAYLATTAVLSVLYCAASSSRERQAALVQAALAVAILAGLALVQAAAWLASALPRLKQAVPAVAAGLGAVTLVPALVTSISDFNLRGDYSTWNQAVSLLNGEPRSAVVYTRDDAETFPLWYAQRAGHLRPDVEIIPQAWLDAQHQR